MISNEGTEDGVVIADAIVWLDVSSEAISQAKEKGEDRVLIRERKREVDRLTEALKQLEKSTPDRPTLMAAADHSEVGDIHLAIRGVTHQKGALVPRGTLRVVSWEPFPEIPSRQSGRARTCRLDDRSPQPAHGAG